ncbi:hypothetical protein EKN56_12745 [Limnobaculum zhutongyuii]|uniref:Uncharacterized protein n=1 Tax=Limnobaculum zhutongyuii TaxID=2498113 RepID=A0A411WLU6_9GAMM|nr:hypothetical protein [Limnobaculum zhutongyuii]QBH97184.1 hypothetical protein EKN56_12745 [Limnobaculum zhutongyuii]
MTNYDPTVVAEEIEELTAMLATLALATSDDGESDLYFTTRAMFKKARALEAQIHEWSTDEILRRSRNEKAA